MEVTGKASGISVTFGASVINKCYNKGKVTSEHGSYNGAGGICGRPASGNQSLMNCYNTGDVTCLTGWAGGMTMYSSGTMKNCYNLGVISGGNSSGNGGVARYYSEYDQ